MLWNIAVACNRASADFLISSPLMSNEHQHLTPGYEAHVERVLESV